MKSLWNGAEAANFEKQGPLGLRVYTSRLLGRDKSLVLHGGGDNHSDQPKPNGGGGDRIACGVVQAGEKP